MALSHVDIVVSPYEYITKPGKRDKYVNMIHGSILVLLDVDGEHALGLNCAPPGERQERRINRVKKTIRDLKGLQPKRIIMIASNSGAEEIAHVLIGSFGFENVLDTSKLWIHSIASN